MKTAAMYLRKSRQDEHTNKTDKETLARHERTLNETAKEAGLVIGHIYREVVSGDSIEMRPQMQELLADLDQGKYEALLVMDVDRLGRGSISDQGAILLALQVSGCKIVTPTKVIDTKNQEDLLLFEFGMFFARREYSLIKKRMERGINSAVKEGQWLGHAPYGYKVCFVGGAKKLRSLESDPKTAPVVKQIFKLQAQGKGLFETCRILQSKGIKTPSGKEIWNATSITNIVTNRVYLGETYRGMKTKKYFMENGIRKVHCTYNEDYLSCKGLHNPLVSVSLWNAAQNGHTVFPQAKGSKKKYLYGKLLVCSKCGTYLKLKTDYHSTERCYYIHVHQKNGMPVTCDCANVKSAWFDEKIKCLLKQKLEDIEVTISKSKGIEKNATGKNSQSMNARSIRTKEQELDNLFGAFERGDIEESEFSEELSKLNKELEAMRIQLEAFPTSTQIKENQTYAGTLHKAIDMLDDASIDATTKRDFLRGFIERIEYYREPGGTDEDCESTVSVNIVYK